MRGPRAIATAALALAAASVGAAAVPAGSQAARVERRLGLMGTTLALTVEARDRATALAASERAVAALEATEARLSTWRDDTELARLNRAAIGRTIPLSASLAAELAAARRCWEETEGVFDPAIGELVAAWGLRTGGKIPGKEEQAEARAAGGMDGLRVSPSAAVRLRDGAVIEEGGFGKGAGLAAALDVLSSLPGIRSAVLDLGGQLALLGAGRREVLIADPRRRDRPVLALAVEAGSVSTSSDSERPGHLLDPRTGAPAADFGSLTVWTADPLRADCLSTGLFVLGPERALEWAAARPDVEVLALVREGERLRALATPGLAGRLRPLVEGIEVRQES
ncbi:MAG TPA: FAD:protein FMN transferase [Thermoanaerobaculia bacterium]|nr:FAD:protein FMN transferase [Thermoanaerobaculia bacterium]